MDISKPVISSVLPEQWDYDILEDGRIVYFQLGKPAGDKSPFQWIPPSESWKHFNQIIHDSGGILLPFGIELAYDATGCSYYLSHTSQQTFRDLLGVPPAGANQGNVKKLKEVDISRHPLVGYGFMLSKDPPLFISHVVPGGPADGKLIQGDLLYCIHGHDVTLQASTDDVLGAIETSLDPQVLQVAVVPKPKPRNKRPPPPPSHKAKVRFNTPLFEVMSEDDGSFLRIHAATGSEHVLRVTTNLTFEEVTTALRDKLHMNCPVKTLGIVATRQSNRITLPPALLVNQSFLRSSDGWKFCLRIRILPTTLDELSIRCPSTLSYLYSQTCNDVYSGYFIVEISHLAELLAIRIWHEFIRTHSSKSRSKKPNQKSIRKMGGFDAFLPRIWIERSTLLSKKDLNKQISNQISRCKIPNDEFSIMLLFLKRCVQYISAFGGNLFHAQVEFLDKVTRICISPAMGISEEKVSVNDIKSAPIYSPIVDFSEIVEVHVTEFSRRDDLSKVRLCCVNGKELIFIMRLYDGCELGEVLQAYYRQRVQGTDILKDTISKHLYKKSSPTSPKQRDTLPPPTPDHESISPPIQTTTNIPIPPYQSTHLVPPRIWSYLFNSSTPPDTLLQFSPLNLPIKLSKKIRVSSSSSRGRESGGEFGDHLLATSHSETYFSDSFDEVTDSESEEYTLEVPTQFLKESNERVNVIEEREVSTDIPLEVKNDKHDSVPDMSPPDITIDATLTEDYENISNVTAPAVLTGIPPPPILKGAEISFERLTHLVRTPPSPVDDMTSPLTTGFFPRSTSDRSLKARSDTILSTFFWHSKYEHLYPRSIPILPLHPEANKNIFKTTHVDAVSTTNDNRVDFIEKPDDSRQNTTNITESEDSITQVPLNSSSEQDSDPNRNQIGDSSSNELSYDDECIVLRLPPPVPIETPETSTDLQDLIQTPIEVSPDSTQSLDPSPLFLTPRDSEAIDEYKPIARRRSHLRDSEYSPDPLILSQTAGTLDNSPETLRRPPSLFAETDPRTSISEKGMVKIPFAPVQRIPIPRSSFGMRGAQAPMPAHRPLSNRIGYRILPPKATPRRPSSSNEFINQLESDRSSVDPSSIHVATDIPTFIITADTELNLANQTADQFETETNLSSNLSPELVSDTGTLDQQDIEDTDNLIGPVSSVLLSEDEIDSLVQLLEPPSPTKEIDEPIFTSDGVEIISRDTEEKSILKDKMTHFLMDVRPAVQPLEIHSVLPSNSETQPVIYVTKTEGENIIAEELNSVKPNSTKSRNEPLDPISKTFSNTKRDTPKSGVGSERKPTFSSEGPSKSQQKHPVMILTDPDPTRIQSMTEQLMQQFNISDPTGETTLPPISPPEPMMVYPRVKPPNRRPRSQSPFSSRLTTDQFEEESVLTMSQESKDTLYEVESSNDTSMHRDSGISTSVDSAHFPQHSTSPIRTIHVQEKSPLLTQPEKYIRAGNTQIRSARSIELFDRNPSFEPSQRPPLPPIHFSPQFDLNLPRTNTQDNPESSSDDSNAPPIPTTDPPTLGDTDINEPKD